MSQHFTAELMFSSIPFSHLQYYNEITFIGNYGKQKLCSLSEIFRPTPKPVYNVHDPIGLQLLTRSRLGLSYLKEHSFPISKTK